MNTLVISPYSNSDELDSLDFVFKQTLLTAKIAQRDSFLLVSVGCGEYGVSFSQPIKAIKNILKAFSRRYFSHVLPNFSVCFQPSIQIYKLGDSFHLNRKAKKIIKILRDQNKKIDIIHAHFTDDCGIIAYLVAKELRIPFVVTEHSSSFVESWQKSAPNSLFRCALDGASLIIGVSNFQSNTLKEHGLKQVLTLHNFIDSPKPYHLTKNKKTYEIVSIGNLVEIKGFSQLIQAVGKLVNFNHADIQLKIFGSGPLESFLKDEIKRLSLSHCIKLGGFRSGEEIKKIIAKSDLLVLSSRKETFGIVLIEALSLGVPVIATRCGGPSDIIQTDKVGILVDSQEPECIAEGMMRAYRNKAFYKPLEIRQYFEERFSDKAIVPQLLSLYQQVIHDHSYSPYS